MPDPRQQQFHYFTDAQLAQRDKKNFLKGIAVSMAAMTEAELALCPYEKMRSKLKAAMETRCRMALHKLETWGLL